MGGTYILFNDMDPLAKESIASLTRPDSLKEKGDTDLIITPEDHTQAWKKQKESIARKPSTFSNGYY